MEIDFAPGDRSRMFECPDIRVFVSQTNVNRKLLVFFKNLIQAEPRPAAARANVHDVVRSRILKRLPQVWNNGFIEIPKIHEELECVGSGVSQRPGEPGLVENLDQLHPPHWGHSIGIVYSHPIQRVQRAAGRGAPRNRLTQTTAETLMAARSHEKVRARDSVPKCSQIGG